MPDWLYSALHPAGPQAARILSLWPVFFWGSALVFVLVIGFLGAGLLRRRAPASPEPSLPGRERGLTRGVTAASVLTVLILFVLLGLDLGVGRAITLPRPPAAVIKVTGHQWWWEVEYDDSVPSRHVITANEVHVPVGQPVLFVLESPDVIHSLWVPSLGGKKDVIPGHRNSLWLQADSAGVYRGQCAEFCGAQHAKMGLLVIAEPSAQFEAWLDRQRDSARTPTDSLARRGKDVFLSGTCAMCHAIGGTPAGSRVGPDLTHVASRRTIAAATLPNTRGHLAGWVVDPQQLKPGVRMPPNQLSASDLQALLAYLRTLQ
jgi:cytochrome c oxidase subunit II